MTAFQTKIIGTLSTISAAIFCLLLNPLQAFAEDKPAKLLYEVEFFIIQHLYDSKEETWPNDIELVYPSENLAFFDDQPTPPKNISSLKTLDNADDAVTAIDERIKNSRHYKMLYQQRWMQDIQEKSQAENIIIQAGESIDGIPPIAGSIKLYKGRYLHIDTNLWFVEFVKGIKNIETAEYDFFIDEKSIWPLPPIFSPRAVNLNAADDDTLPLWTADITRISQIKQSRKMRSKELHYIDHPLYGVLIKITPVISP